MSKESYIVSALKYRPLTWGSVVGQSNITDTLQKAIDTGQLAQAYLFCGPRGVGKTTIARIFARSINQVDDKKQTDFSYNIFELDAASNNHVDDIRNITDQVRIPPQIGKYKVHIIDEVHMLSSAAFNAFLKTLEEPPPHAIFILATTEKHKIIPTILSRCQVYDFNRITVKDIADHLEDIAKKEKVVVEKEALMVIAEKADGALRDALSVFDQMVNFCNGNITYEAVIKNLNILDHDYFFKISDKVYKNDIHETLMIFDEILAKGFDGHHFITGLGSHFRNLLVCRDKKTISLLELSDKIKDQFIDQSNNFDSRIIIDILKILSEADIHYRTSKNQRLHVELALMKMASLSISDEKKKQLISA
jgi:DNA polymerase-3 subunit gamma/tau